MDTILEKTHSQASLGSAYELLLVDLENLLNTHKRCITAPLHLPSLASSIINYGMDDFFYSGKTEGSLQMCCEQISRVIQQYEPRLQHVTVTIDEQNAQQEYGLATFRIEANYRAEDASVLEFSSLVSMDVDIVKVIKSG